MTRGSSSSGSGAGARCRGAAAATPLSTSLSSFRPRRPPSLLLAQHVVVASSGIVGRRRNNVFLARATSGDDNDGGDQPSGADGEAAAPAPSSPSPLDSPLLAALEQRGASGDTSTTLSSGKPSALDSPLLKALAEQLEPPPPAQTPMQQQQADGAAPNAPPTATQQQQQPQMTIDAAVEIPPATLRRIRQEVFPMGGVFTVTEVESYGDGGAVFKGRVRAKDLSAAYEDLSRRLTDATAGEYQLFLLTDRRDEPTAVVLPASAREAEISRTTEVWLSTAFAIATLATSIDAAGAPLLQFLVDPFRTPLTAQDLTETLPLVAAEWGVLAAHELGHRLAAARRNVGLYAPLLIPSGSAGFLPSFGAITRFRGFVQDRTTLLEVSAAGPAFGAAASGALLLVGAALTAAGATDVSVDSASFADSLLVGALAQLCVGADALAASPEVRVNSALLAGWAGLTIQALNCLPLGETDGGRISLALLGRRGARAVGVLGTAALVIASFSNALLGLWLLVVLILQRGPVLPCREELSEPDPDSRARLVGALLLTALPALVLLPYPIALVEMATSGGVGGDGLGIGGAITGGGPLFGA